MTPLFVLAAGLAMGAEAGIAQKPADLVITAGTVITLDGGRPRATAVAVRDGRIVAVGDAAEMQGLIGPATRRIDLPGATVVPGLGDAHVHVEGIGDALETIDLVGAATLDEAVARVRAGAAALPAADWVRGRGWDQNDWPEKRFPTAAALDAATGGRPAFLERIDGHAAWVNSRALALAGRRPRRPPIPPAGASSATTRGGPPACWSTPRWSWSRPRSRPPPARRASAGSRRGCARARKPGSTSVHDAGVDLAGVALYKELLAEGPLPVRAYLMLRGPDEFLAHPELRPEIGLGDGQLTIRSIKVVADGALGSRGALLLAPVRRRAGHEGPAHRRPRAFRTMLRARARAGIPGEHPRHRRRRQPAGARRLPAGLRQRRAAPRSGSASSTPRWSPPRTWTGSAPWASSRPSSRPTAPATCTGRPTAWGRSARRAPTCGRPSSPRASGCPRAATRRWSRSRSSPACTPR